MGFRRTKTVWRVRGEAVTLGVRTLLTARIDLTSGARSVRPDPAAILDRAQEFEAEGADFIELNPCFSAPLTELPDADDELRRLVPILRKVGSRLQVPIAVLTVHTATARRAIDLGASVVHDMSGLAYDRTLASALNETDAALVLGHMRGTPAQWPRLAPLTNLSESVRTEWCASLLRAHQAGLELRRIVLDPGLEHGKRGHENFNLLRSLAHLAPPHQAVQVTLAGKRFLVESIKADAAERAAAQGVAAALAVEAGAHLLTVERPAAIRHAVAVLDRIYRGDEELAAQA